MAMPGIDDFLDSENEQQSAAKRRPASGIDSFLGEERQKSGLMRRAVGDTAVSAVKGAVGL